MRVVFFIYFSPEKVLKDVWSTFLEIYHNIIPITNSHKILRNFRIIRKNEDNDHSTVLLLLLYVGVYLFLQWRKNIASIKAKLRANLESYGISGSSDKKGGVGEPWYHRCKLGLLPPLFKPTKPDQSKIRVQSVAVALYKFRRENSVLSSCRQ